MKELLYGADSIDRLPLPVILISSDCVLLAANKKAVEVFGGFEAGKPLSAMIGNANFIEACARVFENGEPQECEIIHKERRKRVFQASISPFHHIKGEGAFIALFEITATREMERMRSSFVADVSHELRSPLTTLIAIIETLKGKAGDNPEKRARFIELMAQETERMHGIVNDLLALSATEAIEHIRPSGQVNLVPIVTGITNVLSTKARARGMNILLEIEGDIPDIRGENNELYQAIYNLVDNAIKYGLRDTNVTIWVTHRDKKIQVKVHNICPPIPRKHIPRLTERFYRVDKSRSRDIGGTGLGLAIVKHIINRHLGELNIQSSEEEGTIFSVSFPSIDVPLPG